MNPVGEAFAIIASRPVISGAALEAVCDMLNPSQGQIETRSSKMLFTRLISMIGLFAQLASLAIAGATNFTITNLVHPPADATFPYGLNNAGQIVGQYSSASDQADIAFLYDGGLYSTIRDPLGTLGTRSVEGINNPGQIIGIYTDQNGDHGFLDNSGIFTTIDDPLATNITLLIGINDAGPNRRRIQQSESKARVFIRWWDLHYIG
jgi:hypothetical protein